MTSRDDSPLSIVGPERWGPVQPPSAGTLPELLSAMADAHPDAPAVVAEQTRRSYRELDDRARAFAASLAAQGVTAETRIALLAPNCEEWIVAAFGAMRLGVAFDAFNTWVHAWDLEHLLTAAATEILITVPRVRSNDLLGELKQLVPEAWDGAPSTRFPDLRTIVVIGGDVGDTPPPATALDFDEMVQEGFHLPPAVMTARAEDPAFALYTSGTTEYPKAVPLRHRHLVENGFSIGERMGFGETERVWLGSPLFWSFGIANAGMATFTHGGCLVLQERFTPTSAAALLAEEECTAAYLLPSIALALAEEVGSEIAQIPSLRTGLIIGRPEEFLRAAEELGIGELCNVYGATEVYGNCCVTDRALPLEVRAATQGRPLAGVEVRIVDVDSGEIVRAGELGEIQVRGRVMPGYLGNAAATAAAIDPEGWYRTGDLGRLRVDGLVQFDSRHSDMIKTSGINVSPSEVEAFLSSLDVVDEVVVVGAPHPSRGEVPVAFIVPHHGRTVSEEEIILACKNTIASYKVPWAVEVVDSIPKTATGKTTRKELHGPAARLVEARIARTQAHEGASTR